MEEHQQVRFTVSTHVHGSKEVMSAIRTAEIDDESLSKMFQSTYLSQLVQYLSLRVVQIQSSCVLRCCLHVWLWHCVHVVAGKKWLTSCVADLMGPSLCEILLGYLESTL